MLRMQQKIKKVDHEASFYTLFMPAKPINGPTEAWVNSFFFFFFLEWSAHKFSRADSDLICQHFTINRTGIMAWNATLRTDECFNKCLITLPQKLLSATGRTRKSKEIFWVNFTAKECWSSLCYPLDVNQLVKVTHFDSYTLNKILNNTIK